MYFSKKCKTNVTDYVWKSNLILYLGSGRCLGVASSPSSATRSVEAGPVPPCIVLHLEQMFVLLGALAESVKGAFSRCAYIYVN